MKNSPLNKSFLIGMVVMVFLLAAGYGIWWLVRSGAVEFSVIAPKEVKSGEKQLVTFAYKNGSKVTLENAEILITLPERVYTPEDPEARRLTIALDSIAPGASGTKTAELVVLGEKNSVTSFDTTFKYKPASITSVLEKKISTNISIYGSAIGINVDIPTQILPETDFGMKISWDNQTGLDFADLRMVLTYPNGYILNESNIVPKEGNNVFSLGDVGPGSQGFVELNGYIAGQGGENKKFNISIGTYNNSSKTFSPIATLDSFSALVANPLSLTTTVNDQTVGSFNPGDNLEIKIAYQNNYSVGITGLTLKTILDGNMFDYTTLITNKGYFSAKNKTITWTESQIPGLAVLNPGESGEVKINVKLKDSYTIKNFNDKNFTLEVKSSLASTTPPVGIDQDTPVKTSSSALIKLNTRTELLTTIFYRDTNSGLTNCGTLPLRADSATCLTVHWLIKNYSNNLNDVKVITTLPAGVEYTGKYSGNFGGSGPVYDSLSKQFTWSLTSIPSGSGIISKGYELVFQISVTPSTQDINSAMDILGESNLSGQDAFTLGDIGAKSTGFKSNNLTDKTINPADGIVR